MSPTFYDITWTIEAIETLYSEKYEKYYCGTYISNRIKRFTVFQQGMKNRFFMQHE